MFSTIICSEALSQGIEQFYSDYKYSNMAESQLYALNWTNGTNCFAEGELIETILHGCTALYKNQNKSNKFNDLLFRRNRLGISYGTLDDYLDVWYASPHKEHILRYTLNFGNPGVRFSVLPKDSDESSRNNELYYLDESGDKWEKASSNDTCMIDWEWIKEAFDLSCASSSKHIPGCCSVYNIQKFISSFSRENNDFFKILRGKVCIAFKGNDLLENENTDGIVGKKKKLEQIGKLVLEAKKCWPREFSHFKNASKFSMINPSNFNIKYKGNHSSYRKKDVCLIYFTCKESLVKWIKSQLPYVQRKVYYECAVCYDDYEKGLIFDNCILRKYANNNALNDNSSDNILNIKSLIN